MDKLNVIFMGTPQFAVPCLEELIVNENVIAVFTQPDKPKGRGNKIQSPPVKITATKAEIQIFQPISLKNDTTILPLLEKLSPDIIIVTAYGKILPKYILEIPKYGCINIHASLLPKYRGSAPIQHAILNGETETGITSMYMNEGMDTGDMLLQETVKIRNDESAEELYTELSKVGAKILLETLKQVKNKTLKRQKQTDNLATYAPMITKEMSFLDKNKTAEEVYNQIRSITAYTDFGGKRLKIYKSSCDVTPEKQPKTFKILCGDGRAVSFLEVQLEGSKRMGIEEFLNGQGLLKTGILWE